MVNFSTGIRVIYSALLFFFFSFAYFWCASFIARHFWLQGAIIAHIYIDSSCKFTTKEPRSHVNELLRYFEHFSNMFPILHSSVLWCSQGYRLRSFWAPLMRANCRRKRCETNYQATNSRQKPHGIGIQEEEPRPNFNQFGLTSDRLPT